MTTWDIRAPRPDELELLAALGRDTFIETFGHLYSKADLDDFLQRVFSPAGVAYDMAQPGMQYQVAISSSGEWVGYCKVGPTATPVSPALTAGRRHAELRQLYVRGPYQGVGLARLLMDWGMAQLRAANLDDIYLSVWSENQRAQRFYQRYGFAKVGEYAFMVGQQADREFIYRLQLTP